MRVLINDNGIGLLLIKILLYLKGKVKTEEKRTIMEQPAEFKQCPITDLPVVSTNANSYSIEFNGEKLFIRHGIRFDVLLKSKVFLLNRHLLAGAILNRQLRDPDNDEVYWFTITLDNIEEKINSINFPKSTQSKLDNLFLGFAEMYIVKDNRVMIHPDVQKASFYHRFFFKSFEECKIYITELHNQDLIDCTFMESRNIPASFSITFQGFRYLESLYNHGENSNRCFIAMSFSEDMKEIRDAIKLTVESCGYEHILIDEIHLDSTQTINDGIVAELRRCKFCIADFTQQKHGVYFESGFALGLGKPVIYSCRKDSFDDCHFDTSHFPHLIYESTEELQTMLKNKIDAWIE